MKKRQYQILMTALGLCVLAAVIRIFFIFTLEPKLDGKGEKEKSGWEYIEDQSGSRKDQSGESRDKENREKGKESFCCRAPQRKGSRILRILTEKKKKDAAGKNSMAEKKRNSLETVPFLEQAAETEVLPEELPEETGPPVLYIASDLHYQSASSTDYGKAFEKLVRESDGKLIRYLPQILDVFIDEIIQAQPDALLLTGDITMNGERANHLELAGKLARLSDAGIQVLVIPGNHDINNSRGSVYFGSEKTAADSVSFQEFQEIYQEFGWNQAISRDSASFSYLYPLNETVWLMLLDTAQYDPINLVEGAVREETLAWMEENLEKAREEGAQVIVSGHHNLLPESGMFTTQCVLENSETVIQLLEDSHLPLYISGHLHLQRIQKHQMAPGQEGYGIYEIVSNAFSIPPCQYGSLSWQEDGTVNYETHLMDVGGWACRTSQEDENLLNFETYEKEYVQELIKTQILDKITRKADPMADQMAELYAEVYAGYCAGQAMDVPAVMAAEAYQCWLRYLSKHETFRELTAMLKDCRVSHNSLVIEP